MAPVANDDDDHLNCEYSYNNFNGDNNSNTYRNLNNSNSYKKTNVRCETTNTIINNNNNQNGYYVNNQLNDSIKKVPDSKSSILDSIKGSMITYGTSERDNNDKSYATHNKLAKDAGDGGESGSASSSVGVSDIIGSFGWFQLLVLIFSGLREGLVGYDALIMSIILQPESKFLCADNVQSMSTLSQLDHLNSSMHATFANFTALFPGKPDSAFNETAQCFIKPFAGRQLNPINTMTSQEPTQCTSWIFPNETHRSSGPSLVAEWSLVCQNHWLVAFIESAYFFGLVTGNLVWGYYADKVGRRPAYLAAHSIGLIFGSLAVIAPSIGIFAFCRFLSAFGSIGYNIIYSIQVELIGTKHRSFSTIMNHLGWGLGVICVPLVDHLFDDYRPIIAVAPVFSLLMFPWAFWLPESPRWLIANGRFKEARRELLRAADFNGKSISSQVEKKISALEHKILADKSMIDHGPTRESNNDNCKQAIKIANNLNLINNYNYNSKHQQQQQKKQQNRSYALIFTNKRLLRDTLILSYSAFVGHLFYYLQTINFAYIKNLSTAANFITSGAGEWVSVVVGAILLKVFSRKTCMSLFLFLMTCSFTFQSFIDSGIMPGLDTTVIITANNGIGTLASLLLVFVTLIVNQEVYPTVVRQTGTSITNTLGESGSTLAPMVIQFSRLVGAWRANLIYSLFCLFGILVSQFVTKTDDIELLDN